MLVQRHAANKWIKNDALDASIKYDDGEVTAHCHEFYELELILEGAGTYMVDDKTYEIQRGALFFMSPVSFHRISYRKATRLVNIMFPLDEGRAQILERICLDFAHAYTLLNETDVQFIVMLTQDLEKLLSAKTGKEKLLLDAYLQCILAKLAGLSMQIVTPRTPEPINRVLVWLHNNFKHRISVLDGANVANYSPHYFCEIFKKNMRMTFNEYLEELRFSQARSLLRYTSMTVTQICYECGFADYSHFTKRFKARYGESPSSFRNPKNDALEGGR